MSIKRESHSGQGGWPDLLTTTVGRYTSTVWYVRLSIHPGYCQPAVFRIFVSLKPGKMILVSLIASRPRKVVGAVSSFVDAAYEFGQTTLDGHALAGEERFRVSLKQDGSVW